MVVGRPGFAGVVRDRFWQAVRDGMGVEAAAWAAGVSETTGQGWFKQHGGVMPPRRVTSPVRLSFSEREDIALGLARGDSIRQIARDLGRSASTISREVRRNRPARGPYKGTVAQSKTEHRARRPKPSKLATNPALRHEVESRLRRGHSPQQIAARLVVDFPDDPEMRVSHETIYQCLYLQARGGLKRELATHLRTGRAIRHPHHRQGERRGRIAGMVNIAERPAEVDERTVPGHWEGDLIMGTVASNSAIGTLVERVTGYTMLVHLPDGHKADQVQTALTHTLAGLPDQLRRSLTWDQGTEMRNHLKIAAAADIRIYFADPHSPWQRASNENTNGLLRQYFPKSTDLSTLGSTGRRNHADIPS